MARLVNDPAAFAGEMLEGFVAAYADRVAAVPGGVIAARRRRGHVALVVGGGSGHHPAFAGYVGPGLASGAAMGEVFASPSVQRIVSVAEHADAGAGVLLGYGNYAGDVLNFDLAQERLRTRGIRCESIAVTDDVASAPPSERHRRRGIAGDLAVFKVAGAAAAEGRDLAEVAALARHADARTRSLGVAFSGCTLPGADEPLFTVPPGRMALGLGIHGEPGIDERDVPTADELAELLLDRLLEERPADAGARVGLAVNGLGAVAYEELFVLYRSIARRAGALGLEPVAPLVGEYCTSLDMAGVSLTVTWLDDELESLYTAPCDAVALRVGPVGASVAAGGDEIVAAAAPAVDLAGGTALAAGDGPSAQLAELIAAGASRVAERIDAAADELGRIDAVAGDGDHGIGMRRGSAAADRAAAAAVRAGAGAASTLRAASDAWSDRGGGTSGVLWGLLLAAVGDRLGDRGAPTAQTVAAAAAAGVAAVRLRGGAEPGDKTMIDALQPFADALLAEVAAGRPLAEAWSTASDAAEEGARRTAELVARRGRSRTHGARSIGTPDAGAVSAALVARTIAELLGGEEGGA